MATPTQGLSALLTAQPDWSAVLAQVLRNFDCVTGTIHRTDPSTGLLELIAHQGIPPQVQPMLLPKISSIPFGRGIAGCAAQRKEAVQLCNLQEDLGDRSLLNQLESEGQTPAVYALFRQSLEQLAQLQVRADAGLDYGQEQKAGDTKKWNQWVAPVLVVQTTISPTWKLAARAEGFRDPRQVLISTLYHKGSGLRELP